MSFNKDIIMEQAIANLSQMMMWGFGILGALMFGGFLFIWQKIETVERKLDDKIDRVDAKLTARIDMKFDENNRKMDHINDRLNDIDKRLYAVEMLLHMKDCCVLKHDQNSKKVE